MSFAPPTRRNGGATVLLLLALGVVFVLGFRVVALFGESIVWRKGIAATEAAARTGLYLLEPMEFTPADIEAPLHPTTFLDVLTWSARSNGLYPELFHDLESSDILIDRATISVLARPLSATVPPIATEVYGIPAFRISEGRHWLENGSVIAATGCLPVGIQQAFLPVPSTLLPFSISFGFQTNAVTVVHWSSGSTPAAHIQFLGYTHGSTPEGLPPPELALGNTVTLLDATPSDIAELQARITGRIVVVPVLDGQTVTSFLRIRLLSLDATADGYETSWAFVPSATVRSALPPPPPGFGPPPLPSDIPALGGVLRPWRDS